MKYVTFYAPSHPWEGRYIDSWVSSVPPGDVVSRTIMLSWNQQFSSKKLAWMQSWRNGSFQIRSLIFSTPHWPWRYLKCSSVAWKADHTAVHTLKNILARISLNNEHIEEMQMEVVDLDGIFILYQSQVFFVWWNSAEEIDNDWSEFQTSGSNIRLTGTET